MIAKPILDIGIAVSNFEIAAVCIEPIEQLVTPTKLKMEYREDIFDQRQSQNSSHSYV
ncbi:MAG: hypothetical protein BRC41_05575 [Cyanobacteria bacterium QH_9_48_43]|jgi:uncharacterized membrane protein YccF (DUF307 family)|nr:MAG: hypothetical protein BRC41_05575 [Cyanobacteria bacterium QH_9_48_43]